jgi:hypothetical protein
VIERVLRDHLHDSAEFLIFRGTEECRNRAAERGIENVAGLDEELDRHSDFSI